MNIDHTDNEYEALEQEELETTDEAIAVMLLLLSDTRRNLEKELRDFYSKYGKDGVVTYSEARKWVSETDHRRRLTALLLLLMGELDTALVNIKPHFESFLTKVINKETEFFGTKLTNEDLEKILFVEWGSDDKNWLDRLIDDVELWKYNIGSDWKRSFLRRKHIDDVIKDLNERFDSIENIITKLGLTESTAIGSEARRAIFNELGIKKYRIYTKVDERRCETCGAMHGLIFPISAYEIGVTASPFHPRCRCWEVPIVD